MVQKEREKKVALALRQSGLSYREILAQVPVAKSTLSLWLRDIGLAHRHKRILSEKQRMAALRGAAQRKAQRVASTRLIELLAQKEVVGMRNKPLWLAGTMLYWAEGSKQKETNVSQGVKFSNSDSCMVGLFLKWLIEICQISREAIKCELYIHEKSKVEDALRYWNELLMPLKIEATYFKKHNVSTNRKNIRDDYHGLVAVRVRRSTDLNRKITAWIRFFLKNERIGEWCNW